jgi:ribosomal protein S18 acetylase RimI-like enzyme
LRGAVGGEEAVDSWFTWRIMMICRLTAEMEVTLYNYFISARGNVPYYYSVSFEHWRESMSHDTDYDGKPLFSHLETFLLMNNGMVEGFVQFGLTSFVFDVNGEKNYMGRYGIIRNIHYNQGAKNAHLLLDKATEFFESLAIKKRHAFFHFFGMSCYARQGKLHASEFYVEDLLFKYGFTKEHENVYYLKSLQNIQPCASSDIVFAYGDNGKSISFMRANEKIGGCELNILPGSNICFLKWIYIDDKYAHQGLGTMCMNKLFYELQQKGISRLDTDTADDNLNAQGYYVKTGFADMGRMRSYHTI